MEDRFGQRFEEHFVIHDLRWRVCMIVESAEGRGYVDGGSQSSVDHFSRLAMSRGQVIPLWNQHSSITHGKCTYSKPTLFSILSCLPWPPRTIEPESPIDPH